MALSTIHIESHDKPHMITGVWPQFWEEDQYTLICQYDHFRKCNFHEVPSAIARNYQVPTSEHIERDAIYMKYCACMTDYTQLG